MPSAIRVAADLCSLDPAVRAGRLAAPRRSASPGSFFVALLVLTLLAGSARAQTTTLIDTSLTVPVFAQTLPFQVTSAGGAQFIVGSGIFNPAVEGIAFLSGPSFFQVFALTNGTINVDVFNKFTLSAPGAYTLTYIFVNANGTSGDRLAFSASVTELPVPGYPLPPGAVSWYRAQDNFIDTLGDNNGTEVGSVGFTAGEEGQAFLFGGKDGNNVGAQTRGFPTGSADRTAEGWVRFDNLSAGYYQAVFAYGGPGGGQEFGVAEQGGQLLIDFEYGAVVDPTPLVQGQVYHFAAVSASGSLSLYVNGKLTASMPSTLDTTPGTSLTIGQSTDASAYWGSSDLIGFVDELTFYNRALAPSEIAGIYAAGPHGKLYTAPAAGGLSTQNDPANCGSAGNVCAASANASASCAYGTCEPSCHPGFGDCDGNPANGCETSTVADNNNCGACGNACTGGATCQSSVCVATVPCAPIISQATAQVVTGAGQAQGLVTLVLDTTACTGGAPIEYWTATPSVPPEYSNFAGSPTITIAGLTVGATYTFYVTATNQVGTSAPTTSSPVTIPVPSVVLVEAATNPNNAYGYNPNGLPVDAVTGFLVNANYTESDGVTGQEVMEAPAYPPTVVLFAPQGNGLTLVTLDSSCTAGYMTYDDTYFDGSGTLYDPYGNSASVDPSTVYLITTAGTVVQWNNQGQQLDPATLAPVGNGHYDYNVVQTPYEFSFCSGPEL